MLYFDFSLAAAPAAVRSLMPDTDCFVILNVVIVSPETPARQPQRPVQLTDL